MMEGPVAIDGGKRVPFVFEKGDAIYLDLAIHRYKVCFKDKRAIFYSSYGTACKEVDNTPGAWLEIVGATE